MKKKNILLIFLVAGFLLAFFMPGHAADTKKNQQKINKIADLQEDGPIVENDFKWHKIGRLWTRVTNFGKAGDDAYQNRSPSCDYPGGSGNSYLYRGSVWIGAKVDGVVHVTMPEDLEWTPIEYVHIDSLNSQKADQETWTKYYDVKSPLATGHFPLGIEVTERTYAWGDALRGDFIIYEFTIKNVGIDTDNDGYPDTPRDLEEFYFTYRLDGDISKKPEWPTESVFTNQDDHAGVNSSWGILDLFPGWREAAQGVLTDENADSTLMFMWDGDNPTVPADNGEEDDTGNPAVDGKLQSPGFLGFKILKTYPPEFKPSSFHTNHIYNDPNTDLEAYERMMKPKTFEADGPSGVLVHPQTGKPFPNDYRAIITLGPLDTLAYGDSVVVTAAMGVGSDPDSGGVYSLMKLVRIMEIAQYMVDIDYDPNRIKVAPAPANFEVKEKYDEAGRTIGLRILWDKASEDSINYPDFYGYQIYKRIKGQREFEEWTQIAEYLKDGNWPPPTSPDSDDFYELVDTDRIINGFEYEYRIQTLSNNPIFGVITKEASTKIVPGNKVADDLSRVKVVPNPYIGSAIWNNPQPSEDFPWEHRLQFINLPADATVKIYTLDLDFVAEVKAGQTAQKIEGGIPVSGAQSVAEWDLVTRNFQEAAPGVYIYVVESPSAGKKTGKFVIIR
ncbi:hypothetical protein ACX8XN_06910 [Calditrichota bacterium GD2]